MVTAMVITHSSAHYLHFTYTPITVDSIAVQNRTKVFQFKCTMLSTYHPIRKVSKRNDNINSELYKNASEGFKLRLLQFLIIYGYVYKKMCIPNEWINAVVIPVFKKGTEEPLKTNKGF